MKAQEAENLCSHTLSLTLAPDVLDAERHTLYRSTPGKETWYPLYRKLGGSQDRSGQVWKISPSPQRDSMSGPSRP